jgi:heme A synthase
VQIFLAGLGVFSAKDSALDPHRFFALVLAAIAFVAIILAAVARAGGRAIGLCVLLFVLVFLVQGFLAAWGSDTSAWFGGLHALDGLIIIGLAGYLFATSGRGPITPR